MRQRYATFALLITVSLSAACGSDPLDALSDGIEDGAAGVLAQAFPPQCDELELTDARGVFTTEMPAPYQVRFEATGHEPVLRPTRDGYTVTLEGPVSAMFEAECRDSQLHDLAAEGTTHGDCSADGFAIPHSSTADVTLIRGEEERSYNKGMNFVSNDAPGCDERFHGQLWFETETLVD